MRNVIIHIDQSPVIVDYLTKVENAEFINDVKRQLPPSFFVGTKDEQWANSMQVGCNYVFEHEGISYNACLLNKNSLHGGEFEMHFATSLPR